MYSDEIQGILQTFPCFKSKACFKGVFARDLIPNEIESFPSSLVLNTDPSNMPGEHWVAIYISAKGKGRYFDSYGLPPLHEEFVEFLNNNTTSWKHNTCTIQSLTSISCGKFCVFYLALRCAGVSHKNTVNFFEQHNLALNDRLVESYLKKLKAIKG